MLGGGSPTAGDIRAAFVSWEARPRGEGELSARSRAKASPRGGPPTESQKPCSGVDLLQRATSVPPFLAGGATSRRRRAFCPLKSKASPRGGPPTEGQKPCSGVDLLQQATSVPLLFLWEARPRGEGELSARSRAKLRPGGGAPTEGPKPCSGVDLLQRATSVLLSFLWEARPRGEGELSARSRAKLRPEVGPPTEVPSDQKPQQLEPSDDSSFAQPLALFVGQAEARQDVFGVLAQLRAAGADTAGCAAEFG